MTMTPPLLELNLPNHTQLPESDGSIVQNFQEHPQSILLTESIWPVLQRIHPDEQYCIGQDCGIYWRITEPPLDGCKAPDWFYVPNVPPMLDGQIRRSYVMWQELIAPLIVLEFVSGDGAEERDTTPMRGKFWVYEQAIRVPFYGIYEVAKAQVEVYQLVAGRYELMATNERGHYKIAALGVELGIWHGRYANMTLPWLRWWDDVQENLLLTGEERAQAERQARELAQAQAEQERQARELAQAQAEQERQARELAQQRAARLAAQLRAQGIDLEE